MFEGHCDYALLPQGWRANVRLRAGADGRWVEVAADQDREGLPRLGRWVLPGMPNLHSHAFQRAMAGDAERYGHPDDSFWSWREAMYAHAGRIDPDSLHAIARWLYTEMLEAGYTRVCEFHYVHHRPGGERYAPPAAMAQALLAAADEAGIGLTLLPTLYQRGGLRDEALAPRQLRFGCGNDEFLSLCAGLAARADGARLRVGAAIHSLRAVSGASLQALLGEPFWRGRPLHIHVAEQRIEVDACLAVHGRRPIERLFDLVDVDARWCLVHATHASASELDAIARSGAVVGVCTSTEANLGDGLFDLAGLRARGGAWGIGSDSHIGLDPREELRWLEYQARLASGRRTVLGGPAHEDVAANLWLEAVHGGARACGAVVGGLRLGADADWLVLDEDDPAFAGAGPENLLGRWLFAPARWPPLAVGSAGRLRVIAGRHLAHDAHARAWRSTLARL
ncbi:MAG: formimidoylglutamate deiminase [Xanthomonadales bacterium PRO6]|nr:8-oxoguanine deaminase [Xanthomonadales bacterium]MCE7930548.1 formimidoylglutamate deiminase [Xanthomonadales bacterium PRO6]